MLFSIECDFSEIGFENVIVFDEPDHVIIRSNVRTEDDVEKWKNHYCKAFNTTLNSSRLYDVTRCLFHRRYVCTFGDKRHKGKKKTYTG